MQSENTKLRSELQQYKDFVHDGGEGEVERLEQKIAQLEGNQGILEAELEREHSTSVARRHALMRLRSNACQFLPLHQP